MKKGFTLIELLAVIVILAIIALIAVPTITGLIEKAKKGSVEQSAKGYIDAVDKQKALNLMNSNDNDDINEGILDLPLDSYNVKVKGQSPKKGWVEVTKNGVNRYSLVIGDYVVTYMGDKVEVVKGTEPAQKPTGETIIYRFSSDKLYIGDKIDLKNRKYTNYTKKVWDIDNTIKLVATNETHDMVGIYSTNLDDVLTISTNIDGQSIQSTNNSIYLKHTVNDGGIITKSEICLKRDWGTLCQAGEGTYNSSDDSWSALNFENKKTELLDFFKYDMKTYTSQYDNVYCSDQSCYASLNSYAISEFGDVAVENENLQRTCYVKRDGFSQCDTWVCGDCSIWNRVGIDGGW